MKVSICVPVYNVEKYIRRCIESLLNQTHQDIEVIIVNDCSPDNSSTIIQEYAKKDSRVVVFNHDINKGLMTARRTAYMNAKGDYITFVDSDDYLPNDSIEKLLNAIQTSSADVVSGCIEYISCNGTKTVWQNQLSYGYDQVSVLKSLLTREFGHNLCSKIFRRELLQSKTYISYDNCNNGEDAILFYQIVRNCKKIINIPNVVYHYCQNIHSSTQVSLSDSGVRSILIANKVTQEVCSLYPPLYKLLFNYLSPSIVSLCLRRYIDIAKLKKYVHEYGLEEFVKLKNILLYLSIRNSLVLLKRFIKYNRK